jgi:hypothetical protein
MLFSEHSLAKICCNVLPITSAVTNEKFKNCDESAQLDSNITEKYFL